MSNLWNKPHNAFIRIRHPATDEDIGMTVELKPRSHIDVKRVERQQRDEAIRDYQHKKKLPSSTRQDERSIELLKAGIVGWTWDDEVEQSRRVEYSDETAGELLKDDNFKDQIDEAWADDANFIDA